MAEPRRAGWGIVGPGQIAGVFAESLAASGVGHVAAVCGRSVARTSRFCARHGGTACETLDELLALRQVQAVYVATPHSEHPGHVERALDAGRAVLCEKPLATTPAEVARLHALARTRDLLLLEGWMYRFHPQIGRALELASSGVLGRLRGCSSGFGFDAGDDRTGRLFDPALGGGAILDVGGYPVSLSMAFAAIADDQARTDLGAEAAGYGVPALSALEAEDAERAADDAAPASAAHAHVSGLYAVPRTLETRGRLASTGVDAHAEARLRFASGFAAEVLVSLEEEHGCTFELRGDLGRLRFENPFLPEGRRLGRIGRLELELLGEEPDVEVVGSPLDCFALEALAIADCLAHPDPRAHEARLPETMIGADESIALSRVLAVWREALAVAAADGGVARRLLDPAGG